jgi:hypothetical protein
MKEEGKKNSSPSSREGRKEGWKKWKEEEMKEGRKG